MVSSAPILGQQSFPLAVDEKRRRLGRVRCWIFDLDNTLYPSSSSLFPQINLRMRDFISKALSLSPDDASVLQKRYYLEYGTTLRGLMQLHGVDPDEFLAFVHDIDHSVLAPAPRLANALAALPGRCIVFTNATRRHAEMVLARLGISQCFQGIFDIADAGYIPKPNAASYAALLERHAVEPDSAAMFEDIARNLAPASGIGMVTVLVKDANAKAPTWPNVPEQDVSFVDHVTSDLAGWLEGVAGLS